MSIIVNLDVMMAKRKCRLKELSEAIGITEANLSILKMVKPKRYVLLHWRQFVLTLVVNLETFLNIK